MAGRLGEWSVEDLLQIAKITQKTTSIEVVGEGRSGVIYLRDGGVVHAELAGEVQPAGDRFSQVVEVIVTLAAMDAGTFEFGTRDVPVSEERAIDVKAVFAAMEKDLAREKRLVDLDISWLEGLGASRHIPEPITLKPAIWQLVADLIEPFSLASLERRVGRRKAVALVLTLEAIGVLARDVELPQRSRVGPADAAHGDVAHGDVEASAAATRPPIDEVQPVEMLSGGPLISDPQAWQRAGMADVEQVDPMSEEVTAQGVSAEMGLPARSEDEEAAPAFEPAQPQEADGAHDTVEPVHRGAPIVEIFGAGQPPMHEVVTPSETTLVSDVLGDLKSRFRSGRGQTLEAGYED